MISTSKMISLANLQFPKFFLIYGKTMLDINNKLMNFTKLMKSLDSQNSQKQIVDSDDKPEKRRKRKVEVQRTKRIGGLSRKSNSEQERQQFYLKLINILY